MNKGLLFTKILVYAFLSLLILLMFVVVGYALGSNWLKAIGFGLGASILMKGLRDYYGYYQSLFLLLAIAVIMPIIFWYGFAYDLYAFGAMVAIFIFTVTFAIGTLLVDLFLKNRFFRK